MYIVCKIEAVQLLINYFKSSCIYNYSIPHSSTDEWFNRKIVIYTHMVYFSNANLTVMFNYWKSSGAIGDAPRTTGMHGSTFGLSLAGQWMISSTNKPSCDSTATNSTIFLYWIRGYNNHYIYPIW